MKKSFETMVNKFLESEDLIRISLVSIRDKKELLLENRKNGKMEIFDMFAYELKLKNEKYRGVITKKSDCKFAICFRQNDKVAFGLDDFKVYMGFPESCVKFMAMAVKEEKTMVFIYDSSKMERVFMQAVIEDEKRQNLEELYNVIYKLGFCDGEPEPYLIKKEIKKTMEFMGGEIDG